MDVRVPVMYEHLNGKIFILPNNTNLLVTNKYIYKRRDGITSNRTLGLLSKQDNPANFSALPRFHEEMIHTLIVSSGYITSFHHDAPKCWVIGWFNRCDGITPFS